MRVAFITASPRDARGLKVLSPSPFFLKSYATWRMQSEGLEPPTVDTFVFDPWDTPADIAKSVLEGAYDVLAMSVYIWNCTELFEAAQIIKAAKPKMLIIAGGPQVSPIAEEAIGENPAVDIVPYVTEPGEIVFYHLMRALTKGDDLSTVPNILLRKKDGTIEKTAKAHEDLDLDKVPSPYLDGTVQLSPDKKYMIVLESSRGCPYDCAYCFWGAGSRKVNYYPIDRNMLEIEKVYSNPSVGHVYFADSDFLLKGDRASPLLDNIMQYGGDRVTSAFEIDARGIRESKKEAIIKLSKLPDHRMLLAVQTATPEALKLIGKRANPELFRDRAAMVRSWLPDIRIVLDIMLPLPGDTLTGFINTVEYVLNIEPLRFVMNYPLFLLPGTKYYDERDKLGMFYTPKPRHAVYETVDFPKVDVAKAVKFGFWTEVLTFYQPAVGKYLYATAKLDQSERRVDRLMRWIDAIEDKIDLLRSRDDLIEQTINSAEALNTIKGDFLAAACRPQGSLAIFETIVELEGDRFPDHIGALKDAVDVYRGMARHETKAADPYKVIRSQALPPELSSIVAGINTELSDILPAFKFHEGDPKTMRVASDLSDVAAGS